MTALRIGLPGFGTSVDSIVRQAQRAEADGFTSLWYASAVAGDPLTAMAVAGRETTTIELGTAVLQSYACHPLLQAQRAGAVAAAIGPGRFTLGIGPSHRPVVEDVLGLDYATPGRHTEDYVDVVAPLLRDGDVEVPLLVAALGPRLLRVAGEKTDGTVLWMANARAVADHVAPRIRAAAADAGRPAPRVVAGLPVAVHDDEDEARATAAEQFAVYGQLPNYQRILGRGGVSGPAEAAIVGDE
ncbi:MAG TPA: LLM class flavin-dependent oxidoreductase, partial [Iamia sp.]